MRREAAYVEGIKEIHDKLRAVEAEKQSLEAQLHETRKNLHNTSATVVSLDSALASKSKDLDAVLTASRQREDRWGVCSHAAVTKSSNLRAFRRWAGAAMHRKVNLQMIHTAFASTGSRWFRR
jgi:septal ring factor EnvC (AmiA/AmiB activator)